MNFEKRIVDALILQGALTPDDVRRAEALQSPGTGVLEMLGRLGLLADPLQAATTSKVMSLPLADTADAPEAPPEGEFSLAFLRRAQLVPVRINEGHLEVWSASPYLIAPLEGLRLATSLPLDVRVATRAMVETLLERWYPEPDTLAVTEVEAADLGDVEHLKDLASEAPVIRIVNQVLQRAADLGASDIHLQPFERTLRLRYRIDGVLEEMDPPPFSLAAALISRIKLLGKLDIAERRLPQDGRIQVRLQGRELDLRVSTVPGAHGESVVLRLLDREAVRLDLDAMGFDPALRARFETVLRAPHGIVLITGPTGSGKTTTLYAAIEQLNTDHVHIVTVEDPVEYQVDGVTQIQVKPQIGLDFAQVLRSIMRQDPDVILVGEMRDVETARTAIQSALTGHLVLSTLHTNSAAAGLTRLRDMGIENYLVTSTVNALLAQRLVRRIEPIHAERYLASEEEIARFNLRTLQPAGDIHLTRPRASALSPTGYRGRIALTELVVMSDALRQAVMSNAGADALEKIARNEGSRSLLEDGFRKVLAGLTTFEEVLRVTQGTD